MSWVRGKGMRAREKDGSGWRSWKRVRDTCCAGASRRDGRGRGGGLGVGSLLTTVERLSAYLQFYSLTLNIDWYLYTIFT